MKEIPNDLTRSDSHGCECNYFSNRDGTGWKIYSEKEIAEMARKTQMYFYTIKLAPAILSEVTAIEIKNYHNPLDKKVIPVIHYGFITEEVRVYHKVEEEYTLFMSISDRLRDRCRKITNSNEHFDIYTCNVGIDKSGVEVIIDFGWHFYNYLPDNIMNEIIAIESI